MLGLFNSIAKQAKNRLGGGALPQDRTSYSSSQHSDEPYITSTKVANHPNRAELLKFAINDELVEFVTELCRHPSTWTEWQQANHEAGIV
jgi:hypothetical protein